MIIVSLFKTSQSVVRGSWFVVRRLSSVVHSLSSLSLSFALHFFPFTFDFLLKLVAQLQWKVYEKNDD